MRTGDWLFLAAGAAAIAGSVWLLARRDSDIPVQAQSQKDVVFYSVTPGEAKRRMQSGEKIVILDVRTPEENAEKRIPGSILLPLGRPEAFGPAAEKIIPGKRAVVFVYCRSGRRSLTAAEILADSGYRNVYHLGGIMDWPYETEAGR